VAISTLLVGGLLASGQVSAQEAAQLTRSGGMVTISMSLASHKVDWLAASEGSAVFVDERTIEAASCATSDVSAPDGALQARAFMQAVGRATREIGAAIEGRERVRGSALLTEIEERAVARLPAMAIKEQVGFRHGDISVACVLVTGERR